MSGPGTSDREQLAATVLATLSFLIAIVGALAFAVVYIRGPEVVPAYTQLLGVSAMLAFGGAGAGVVFWAHGLMPQGPDIEKRKFTGPSPEERERTATVLKESTEAIGRRGLLGRLLFGALGAIGVAMLLPFRSLGRAPFPERARTGWKAGRRLVTEDGRPVRIDEMAENSVLTVFPERRVRDADSQTLLLRLPPEIIRPLEGRESWSPEGHIAYSKVCTHAGCPVGLYQVDTQRLLCPCHHSAFSVLRGATPIFGPATRPLPQLPLGVDREGYLIALGDYDVPVGAGFWTWPSAARKGTP
ncbi:MAG TPA: Rieske 2Fe-2S domain-containing protein [Nitriliruptorales bacterium]|nr:Rieske 2Fe-2S domain-containing protein [Nitriliruptorales bacterium]